MLVLSVAEDDPELRGALTLAGAEWLECADLTRLCAELEAGAAVVVLTGGWDAAPGCERLIAALAGQPAWSELPVLVLAPPLETPDAADAARRLGNVILLELPVRGPTLITALQTALRSRRHQYQVREYLREREATERKLRESEERLRFSLEAGRLGFWQHDLATDQLICSELCKLHFGRAPGEPLAHAEILGTVHPEDLGRVQQAIGTAIANGESYVLEYRVFWPDDTLHWVMIRGRASYGESGKPVSTFGVTLDITERKQAEAERAEQAEQLRLLSESLQEAARRKDEFLAMLAHELRNPLAPVANAIEIMRARPGLALGARPRLVVERQLHHLNRLIDDLLDVSRITSGKVTLKKERLDLVEAVEAALESVRDFVTRSGHTLETVLPTTPVYADVDPVRLDQVVANLLNNAAKYTDSGGRIRVTLEVVGETACLRVRDNGIGISASLLEQVFDLFTQGERGLDRSQGGLGLGLTLVRSLTLLHGGTVAAFSDGPDRGSEFVVTLPLASDGVPAVSEAPAATAPAPLVATSRRLLVVDDNRDSAETLAELAEIWGFEVNTAFDGLAALQRADEWEPTLVFLDIGMPGLNGYEVARRLRQDVRFEKITIVALTGYGQEQDLERSRAAGIDHHLVKPVDMALLERLLRGPEAPPSLA